MTMLLLPALSLSTRVQLLPPPTMLYIGGSRIPVDSKADRCHSAVTPARGCDRPSGRTLLDSGAFSDKPGNRLSFAGALERELEWEARARRMWDRPDFKVDTLASYDYLLIDEQWEDGARRKKRWQADAGWEAVDVSIAAASYLASRRRDLNPRQLLYGCQGVTAEQYITCAEGILAIARSDDWFGFGGRCILGRQKRLLQEHYETAIAIIPMVASSGLKHVHIFGVLYEPAIAPLAWLCHEHGLRLSTDSAAPVLAVTRPDHKRAGVRAPTVAGNVAWWQEHISTIQRSKWYRNPRELLKAKQLPLAIFAAPAPVGEQLALMEA